MSKSEKTFIVIGVLIFIAGLFLCIFCNTPSGIASKGRLLFETEQEYTDFKCTLANPDIIIDDMTVLSSDPPIIIDFSVTRPLDTIFDYGDTHTTIYDDNWTGASLMIIGSGILIILGIERFINDAK